MEPILGISVWATKSLKNHLDIMIFFTVLGVLLLHSFLKPWSMVFISLKIIDFDDAFYL